MAPFDRAWFNCGPSGRIPSDDFGIPTRNSKDVTRGAEPLGLPKQQFVENTMRTHAPRRRECLHFKITWAQISSRYARFIFSLHACAVVWPLSPCRDTCRRCNDLGFHDQVAASKRPLAKKDVRWYTPVKIMRPVFISKPCFEYMYNVSSMI